MDKRRAIQIMTKAAKLYKDNLEDRKVIFLYGYPADVKKQIQLEESILTEIKYYEVAFHRQNFLHLTGVKINSSEVKSAIQFYEKCLSNRLSEKDFFYAKDGSTIQKLEVLQDMMLIKQNVKMLGDFTDRGIKLYSEKVAGNVCGCVGFIKDKHTNLNVPNTLLKKDIRDVTASPMQKVYLVASKKYTDDKYSMFDKVDKSINIKIHKFSGEIECKLNLEKVE